MLPQKSYLVRAFYQWIIDSHCTPYVLVNADVPGTAVPREYVEDGEIVLNISSAAVVGLSIESTEIQFEARFSGVPFCVCVPMRAVLAIYANENGRGMVFNQLEEEAAGPTTTPPPQKPGRPHLKVVK